ncbi:MAG TPA: hypothetical protein VJT73_07860 [Polyangiaceae bacterium]|nr:hypothetical protein [Polyangiaceae bacterium]
MTTDQTEGFVLTIDPPSAAPSAGEPRILGMTVALRLALTAQAAGARAIAVAESPDMANLKRSLADARLAIRVIDELDRPSLLEFRAKRPTIRAPANVVVHRSTFAVLREHALRKEIAVLPSAADPEIARAMTRAHGPYGFLPIIVEGAATARAARRALLRSLRKPQDGWTSTHLNRHISLFLTRWLVSTPLQPNQVSVGILGVGLFGAWLASRGTYEALLGGAFLFQAQSVLDGCDGEMSRLTFRGSRTGEWLDTVGDDLTNYGFFAGASWGLFSATGHVLYLALGALTVACGLVGSGLEYRYLIRIGSGDLLKYPLGIGKSDEGPKASAIGRALDAVSPLFKRDTFVFLTLVGAALGWLGPFLVIFAAGAVGVVVAVIKAELRMLRERQTAPPTAAG